MVIMMILKKRLINLLCLSIAINLVSINSSYALTSEQYKILVYGAAAGGAWAGWGTLNAVLAYIERGGGPLTTTDGANIIGAICGANAAAYFRAWSPPTDPVSAANILLAATKSGAVAATASTCRWVSNAFLRLYFEKQQTEVSRLSHWNQFTLGSKARSLKTLESALAEQIYTAASKERAAQNVAATYRHECSYGIVTRYCNDLGEELYRTSQEAKAADLAFRQTAWDIAELALEIARLEGDFVSVKKMSPRPR
ncbi:hypothetical protein [Dickeya dianthicola]|uniref:Uncharacterized protein n=2 Tax=Dickeya dianthicola TaxID=204039 RepID=A0ABX9NQM1_9GAMM|nr:hypothetical protein [Dickeya dianthicola]RJL68005.1 hypothetical protein D5072_11790 [Dickeya dianthicola]RJL72114.1 hypothetical protein D5077_11560 [Dickeya dianthicola]